MDERREILKSRPAPEKSPEKGSSQPISSPERANVVTATTDTLGVEGASFESGNISEILSDNKEQKGEGNSSQTTQAKVDPKKRRAQITAKLLKKAPEPAKMRLQIQKEIQAEITYLRTKALKMIITPGKVNYYEMNNLVKKIRELKSILRMLAKATLENLKTLWLRFVHGIM